MNPDWRISLPAAFLREQNPLTMEQRRIIVESHSLVRAIPEIDDTTVYTRLEGWYGDDREAAAASLRPLMEALTAWRDGRRAR